VARNRGSCPKRSGGAEVRRRLIFNQQNQFNKYNCY
jgi:hypothetical protein